MFLYNIVSAVIGIAGLVAFVFVAVIGPLTIVFGFVRAFDVDNNNKRDTKLLKRGFKYFLLYGLGGIVLVAILWAILSLVGTITGISITNVAVTNTTL